MEPKKTVCVAGASGLVGSHIVRAALLRGYAVNGTLRNKNTAEKTSYLSALPGADSLTLFSANMMDEASFYPCLKNADVIFIACLVPVYKGSSGTLARDMDDEQGFAEIIMPTVNGCLNILNAAHLHGVQKAVICSSTSSTNPRPPVPLKNELDHWSDVEEQCRAKKYTSATKTVMEKEAIKFAKEKDIRLSIILPTGLYGPTILPQHMAHNPFAWLKSLIDGGAARHEKIPNDSASMIHLHDLANLFLAAYEKTDAAGRYFGVYDSLHWKDIYEECQRILPDMQMPEPFIGETAKPTGFDFTRRDSLGVNVREFKVFLRETIEWIQSEPFKT